MKYVKSGPFITNQFSIAETITETRDVVMIASDIIKNLQNVSPDVKKELNLALTNLNQAHKYLDHIDRKVEIALKYVPTDIQEKDFL